MKFLTDVMVCNLARWLRIFGFDTTCARNDQKDGEIAETAIQEKRILLTRDKKLSNKPNALLLYSTSVKEQLLEIKKAFNLQIEFPEKTRCALCNGELDEVAREEIAGKVPEKTKSDKFWLCKSCGKAYWRGAHWKKITKMVEELKS